MHGICDVLANRPISWCTRKQRSVALSTMEAEYIALSELVKKAIYHQRKLLLHMKFGRLVERATTLYCDNQSAIALSKDNVDHPRSKHVDIRYHFTREAQENEEINVIYIRTSDMVADFLTKALPK